MPGQALPQTEPTDAESLPGQRTRESERLLNLHRKRGKDRKFPLKLANACATSENGDRVSIGYHAPSLCPAFLRGEPGLPKARVKKCRCWSLSCVQLFGIPRTLACKAPLSMKHSRQEYWSGQPFPFSSGSSQLRD